MSCNIGGFLKGQVSSCKSGTSLNVPELEAGKQLTDDGQTYAKEQLRVKPNGQSYSGSLGIRCLVKFILPKKTKKKKKKRREKTRILSADISSVQLLLFATTLLYGVFCHHT